MQSCGKIRLVQNKRRAGCKWNSKLRLGGKPVCRQAEKGDQNWCQVLHVYGILQRRRLKGSDGNQEMEPQLRYYPDNHETAGSRIQWYDFSTCHPQRPQTSKYYAAFPGWRRHSDEYESGREVQIYLRSGSQ